jgi:hypothetical protein
MGGDLAGATDVWLFCYSYLLCGKVGFSVGP